MTDAEFNDTDIVYPSNSEPIARYNVSLDTAEKGEDGYWVVIRTLKQVVTFDRSNFFVREKAIKSIDKSFDNANFTTHKAISALLDEYKGDFFSKGEWDGHQYIVENKTKDEAIVEEYHGTIESV